MKIAAAAIACAICFAPAIARASTDVDTIVCARFTTEADDDAISRAACDASTSLHASVRVERSTKNVTSCGEGSRVLVVRIASTATARDVAFEMDLGAISLEDADKVLDELAAHTDNVKSVLATKRTHALSPPLTTVGITLGALGFAAIVASYVWLGILLIKPASCNTPFSVSVPVLGSCLTASDYLETEVLEVAGLATMVVGASLAIIGQQRVKIAPVIAPSRGGFTGGFAIRF